MPSAADAQANARAIYAAYNRRDWDGFFADVDPALEWDPVEEGGVYRGPEAITRLAEIWLDTWDEFAWEPAEIELDEHGQRVFVALRSRGRSRGSDALIEGWFFHLGDLRDGRLWRLREYMEPRRGARSVRVSKLGRATPAPHDKGGADGAPLVPNPPGAAPDDGECRT